LYQNLTSKLYIKGWYYL